MLLSVLVFLAFKLSKGDASQLFFAQETNLKVTCKAFHILTFCENFEV